jgi:hypothetical protein
MASSCSISEFPAVSLHDFGDGLQKLNHREPMKKWDEKGKRTKKMAIPGS